MRYSPLVLMAFPDGLLFSGNDIWVFTVLTGWDSLRAEWVPEGWLDGAVGRFMRRDGKQKAARAKTKVLPFGSSQFEARGKFQPSRKQRHTPCSLCHKCSLHSSQIWAVPWELGHYIMCLHKKKYMPYLIIHYSSMFFQECRFSQQYSSEKHYSWDVH